MKNVLSYVIGLCLALWLGGIVMLLIALMSVFGQRHDLGGQIGPILFGVYEPYQLALAAITIACAIAWRIYSCSNAKKALMACLMGAAILSVVSKAYITPQIIEIWDNKQIAMQESLRALFEGATTLPTVDPDGVEQARFNKLHVTSRYLYTGITVLVLLAGGAYVRAVQADCEFRPPTRKRDPEQAK